MKFKSIILREHWDDILTGLIEGIEADIEDIDIYGDDFLLHKHYLFDLTILKAIRSNKPHQSLFESSNFYEQFLGLCELIPEEIESYLENLKMDFNQIKDKEC